MKKLSVLILFTAFAAAQSKDLTGNLDNGKRLFVRNGCYQCHGYVGQGGAAGARLAQTKLPLAGFTAFVRNPPPSGMMVTRSSALAAGACGGRTMRQSERASSDIMELSCFSKGLTSSSPSEARASVARR